MRFATWPPAGSSPLFQAHGLKRAGEYLTESDLEAQYGFMTDSGERALRQQMQSMGRPLTRAEQRGLMKSHGGMGGFLAGLGDMQEMSQTGSKLFIAIVLLGLAAGLFRADVQAKEQASRR